MYNFSCVMGPAPVGHVGNDLRWGEGGGGGGASISSTKKMFTYVHTKHQIIKYAMVSCHSQAIINYASLCSGV